jgi:hypothetical protein
MVDTNTGQMVRNGTNDVWHMTVLVNVISGGNGGASVDGSNSSTSVGAD